MTHVELQHITIGYGHRVLLEDVSAAIGGGRLVALLGRNGTEKVRCCVRSRGSRRRCRAGYGSADAC